MARVRRASKRAARLVRRHAALTAIVRWHSASHTHSWDRVAVLVDRRRWRHARAHTLASAPVARHRWTAHVATLGPASTRTSNVLLVVERRLLVIVVVIVVLGVALISILAWLALLSRVTKSDLPRQNLLALHLIDALLSSFMTTKLDESEAFRVLRDWVNDDLRIVAAREVRLEVGEED